MATDVGKLIMRFEADDKKLKKSFDNIKTGMANVAKAAAVGTAAIGAALGGIIYFYFS